METQPEKENTTRKKKLGMKTQLEKENTAEKKNREKKHNPKKRLVSLPGGDTTSSTEQHLFYIPFSLGYPSRARARGSHGYGFARSAFYLWIHAQNRILNLPQNSTGRQT